MNHRGEIAYLSGIARPTIASAQIAASIAPDAPNGWP
jgi:UDP-N-acetylmuramyl pentapeptide synthase